jgi:hypothetical protein
LCFRVAAADVAVDAGKPNLLQVFWTAVSCWRIGLPQISAEKRPTFIDRSGMTSDRDVGVVGGIREFQGIFDPSDRIDGVPNADEVWSADDSAKRRAEVLGELERSTALLFIRRVHQPDRIRNQRFISRW